MKLKFIAMIVFAILLFSSINVIGIDQEKDEKVINYLSVENHISFSEASIETENEYCSVNVEETNSFINDPCKPRLPLYRKVLTFPRGTKIKDVEFFISDVVSEDINLKIEPSIKPVPISSISHTIKREGNTENTEKTEDEKNTGVNEIFKIVEDQAVYSSTNLYPDTWHNYEIRCGLHEGKDTVFLIVNCYPVRYSPAENTIYKIESFDFKVTYEEDLEPRVFAKEYDLLIIAPRKFLTSIMPLYLHKTLRGVPTKIKTVESISRQYDGRDKPEQIKYCIKDAKEKWNIKYVLLFGGLKSHFYAKDRDNINEGSKGWYVPVRYANVYTIGEDDPGYLSDLYYADIYKYNETTQEYEFEDWDSNGNDIFLDGDWYDNEEVDLMPDVYYGRLACRNKREVREMVRKIIKYEKPTIISKIFGKPWMREMFAAGGITVSYYEGQPDGEWLCNKSIDYMGDTIDSATRIYASNALNGGPRPIPTDITDVFSEGAGFGLLQGHGSAYIWDTHWPNTDGNWTGGIATFDFPFIRNRWKLPIVVVGGCHNGIFNVTFLSTMLKPKYYHAYGLAIRGCFSWKLVAKATTGAIASTGCTDYGLAGSPPDSVSGGLEANFFYKIGTDYVEHLGEAHGGSIEKYILDNDLYVNDVFCITEYQLFGDPSLKIGGY